MQSVLNNFTQTAFAPLATSVEAPPGIQLLSLSVLLLVFAVAASEDYNQSKSEKASDKEGKVDLIKPDAIGFRSGIATGLIGLQMVISSGPQKGFMPDVTSLESLEGLQFLSVSMLLLVFAMAVLSEKLADEGEDASKVGLLRADAIAFRAAAVAGLIGLLKTFGTSDALVGMASACVQNFDPSVAALEAPEGIQILSVSLLLLVFALAVCEDGSQEHDEMVSQVQLVRADAIAFRLSIVAVLTGLLKTFGGLWPLLAQVLPASPPQGFAPAVTALEVNEGNQLLTVSVLLLVFALAVLSDKEEMACDLQLDDVDEIPAVQQKWYLRASVATWLHYPAVRSNLPEAEHKQVILEASEPVESSYKEEGKSDDTSKVELVRAEAIAFRAAMVAAFFGFKETLPVGPVQGFNPAVVELEAPEGIQFLCISVLLLVFALAVRSDDSDSQEKSGVSLVRVDSIAFRSALFASIVGVYKTFGNAGARAELASLNQTEFAPEMAMLEASEGLQLLCVALLLIVFVAAVNSEDSADEHVSSESKGTQMQKLIRPQTIAFRMALVAGLIGSLMTIDDGLVTLPRMAATGEIALVLGAGVAVMVSDVPRQLVSV